MELDKKWLSMPQRSQSDMERLHSLLRQYQLSLPQPHPDCPDEVSRALSYIHQHLFDPLLFVDRLREECKLRSGFSGRFRFYVGEGPKGYIMAHRLHLGHELLSEPTLNHISVQHIALQLGFNGNGSFVHAFVRKYQISPEKWRIISTDSSIDNSMNEIAP